MKTISHIVFMPPTPPPSENALVRSGLVFSTLATFRGKISKRFIFFRRRLKNSRHL